MSAHDLWFSQSLGNHIARGLLTPASWLYAAGWQAYLGLYRTGIKKSKEPHRPVLCVGNLTVGGSGKSPTALHIYDLLVDAKRPVVVGCSGYGSPAAEGARLAPEGPLSAHEWGDEAAMLRWFRPDMPLAVGRARVRAAELVHQHHRDALLLMDDGFQHLPLYKHVSLILDEANPLNSFCLPAGPYREPRGNRSRADIVIPGVFNVEWSFRGPFEPATLEPPNPSSPRVQVLTAIGRPERFLKNLSEAGYEAANVNLRPDHDPLTAGNLLESVDPQMPLVVTAKDWIKLKDRADIGRFQVWVTWNEARIQPADAFRELLYGTINQFS